MGAALLPRLSVDAAYPGVRALELGRRVPPRVIGLAWHRDRELQPAARELVAATERACDHLAASYAATSIGRSSSA
jgi:DNA-binding transcriptional LysR family regulator